MKLRWILPLSLLLAIIAAPMCAEETVSFRKHYVDGPYGQIHVLTSQPTITGARATPLACFAPNPATGRYFRLFMQTLGSDRVMIAPDYPGLGQSDPPPSMPDMAGYTGAMAEALEALGFGAEGNRGAVDVCGYHTGAMIAIELAVTRPDLVRRLVLMGIPYYDAEERRRQYEKNVVEKSIPGELSGLQGSWDFAVTHREKGVLLERGYETFVDVLKAGNRRHWAYHAVFTYPAEQRAPLVRQPVLILNTHGSLEKETRAMAPYFKQVQLVEIPELHRGIFDVGPDLLAGHAKAFLDQP